MGLEDLNHYLGGPLGGWAGIGWNTDPVMAKSSRQKSSRFRFGLVCTYFSNLWHFCFEKMACCNYDTYIYCMHIGNFLKLNAEQNSLMRNFEAFNWVKNEQR